MKTPTNGSWSDPENHEHGNGRGNGNGNGNGELSNGYESRSLARRSQPYTPIRRGSYGPELGHLPMAMMDQQEKRRFSFGDYLGLIWRGKWIILACIVVVGLLAAYHTFSQPYVYQSSLQIIINERDASMSPLFAGSERFFWQPPERILKKELQILTSQPIIQQTAEALISRRFIDTLRRDSVIPVVAAAEKLLAGKLKGASPAERQEMVLKAVAGSVRRLTTFKPSKDADIIQIITSAGDPDEAAVITNIYAQVYEQDNQEQNRSKAKAVKDFLAAKLETTRDSLGKQEILLKNYREGEGIVGLDDQARELLASSSKLDANASETQIEMEAIGQKLQESKRQLRERDATLPQEVASTMPEYITAMTQQIATLEVNRQIIIANNPVRANDNWYQTKLKSMDDQIAGLRAKLETEVEKFKNSRIGAVANTDDEGKTGTTALGILRRQIFDDEIVLQSLRARLTAIRSNQGEIATKLTQVPSQELAMQRLERDRFALEKIYMQIIEEYNRKVLEEQSVFSNVRVLEAAQPNTSPISPDRLADIITGAFAGLGIGIGIVLLLAFIDTTIHSPEDLEKNGFVMLTAIPAIKDEQINVIREDITVTGKISSHLITQADPKSPVAEAYRSLRTGIQFASLEEQSRVILVTSSTPQEGKSTTSTNTAIVFAQSGSRTLLIDCDLRRPIIHSVFGLSKEPGLVNCLIGSVRPDEAIYSSMIPNLDVLPSGSIPPNPSELLGSRRMRDLLDELRERYDTIVIDSPPTAAVTDAIILSTLSDITIVVVRAHKTKLEFLQKTRDELERVFVSPLGIVLNDFDVTQSYGSAYKYYRYYKYYGYYGQPQEETGGRKQRRAKAALKKTNAG